MTETRPLYAGITVELHGKTDLVYAFLIPDAITINRGEGITVTCNEKKTRTGLATALREVADKFDTQDNR